MKEWKKEEIEFLVKNYGKMKIREIARRLGRSYGSVRTKAKVLGLQRRNYKFWTEEEKKFLLENIDKLSLDEIAKRLGRSRESVKRMKNKLGIHAVRKWTQEEVAFLIDNYSKMTTQEIAEKLGRSIDSVRGKILLLGLRKRSKPRPQDMRRIQRKWTKEEIEFLKKNASKMTLYELGEKLGRSRESVRWKARELGLKVKSEQPLWEPWEKEFLKKRAHKYTVNELAEILGRTKSSVRSMLNVMGLEYKHIVERRRKGGEVEVTDELIDDIIHHRLPVREIKEKLRKSSKLAKEILERLGVL